MKTLTPEQKAAMKAGREAARQALRASFGPKTMDKPHTDGAPGLSGEAGSPLKAIRAECLDCSGTAKMAKYCPLDGVHSRRCSLWPFRFGMRPTRAVKVHGKQFLTPKDMPTANTRLEDLP